MRWPTRPGFSHTRFHAEAGDTMQIEAAPMGLLTSHDNAVIRWLPSADGFTRFRQVSREALGLLLGA